MWYLGRQHPLMRFPLVYTNQFICWLCFQTCGVCMENDNTSVLIFMAISFSSLIIIKMHVYECVCGGEEGRGEGAAH